MSAAAGAGTPVPAAPVGPLYWLATLTWLGLNLLSGQAAELRNVILSVLFVPHHNGNISDSGRPYLDLGWSLSFEMLFYLIFMIGLASRRAVLVPVIATVGLAASGLLLVPQSAIGSSYTNMILLDFTAGVLIAPAAGRYLFRGLWPLLPLGLTRLPLFDLIDLPNAIKVAIPAAMMVVSALSIEKQGRLPTAEWLHRIGNASCLLYLTYIFTTRVLVVEWRRLPPGGWAQYLPFLITLLVGSVIVAEIAFRYVEGPLTRWINRRTRTSPAIEAVRPSPTGKPQ